jgi:hypothetical protein
MKSAHMVTDELEVGGYEEQGSEVILQKLTLRLCMLDGWRTNETIISSSG